MDGWKNLQVRKWEFQSKITENDNLLSVRIVPVTVVTVIQILCQRDSFPPVVPRGDSCLTWEECKATKGSSVQKQTSGRRWPSLQTNTTNHHDSKCQARPVSSAAHSGNVNASLAFIHFLTNLSLVATTHTPTFIYSQVSPASPMATLWGRCLNTVFMFDKMEWLFIFLFFRQVKLSSPGYPLQAEIRILMLVMLAVLMWPLSDNAAADSVAHSERARGFWHFRHCLVIPPSQQRIIHCLCDGGIKRLRAGSLCQVPDTFPPPVIRDSPVQMACGGDLRESPCWLSVLRTHLPVCLTVSIWQH